MRPVGVAYFPKFQQTCVVLLAGLLEDFSENLHALSYFSVHVIIRVNLSPISGRSGGICS